MKTKLIMFRNIICMALLMMAVSAFSDEGDGQRLEQYLADRTLEFNESVGEFAGRQLVRLNTDSIPGTKGIGLSGRPTVSCFPPV